METNKENLSSKVENNEFTNLNQIYDECLTYLKTIKNDVQSYISGDDQKVDELDFIDEDDVNEMIDLLPNAEDVVDDDEVSTCDDGLGDEQDENIEANNNQHINETIKTNFKIENELDNNSNRTKDLSTEKIKTKDIRRKSLNNAIDRNDSLKESKRKYFSNDEIKQVNESKDVLKPLSNNSIDIFPKSERLRKLSQQLPKIIITNSTNSIDKDKLIEKESRKNSLFDDKRLLRQRKNSQGVVVLRNTYNRRFSQKVRTGYGNYPMRLVSKAGVENVALISNVPFEKIRLLNDTFHTLINLRWRWIVSGTIVVHFAIWLVFAIFWYITALAHYDFEPNPPKKTCITGGTDFVTIFLASVEAQTTIGFGDRTIDEECPESIFLFVMQLILGTGLSGVLTCVVYAKLTRPEKLSRDGVGFSKKAAISLRDGKLCLMMRAWDLNYDHIIGSEFTAHFVNTHRTKEGEIIRYYSKSLKLESRQFLLWPVTLLHIIDASSPLYSMSPESFRNNSYEIVISLKGASASMGTYTQSQTSYLPKEIMWGYRYPPVVRYDSRKRKYVIDKKKLDAMVPAETPCCSAQEFYRSQTEKTEVSSSSQCGTPSSFSDRLGTFHLERTSSFRKNKNKTKE